MTANATCRNPAGSRFFWKSIIMPLNSFHLAGALAAALAIPVGLVSVADRVTTPAPDPVKVPITQIVTIVPGSFTHPQPGEFLKDKRPVAAPRHLVAIKQPVDIMVYQVSLGEYASCVEARACKPADARGSGAVPVTGVSYLDASNYAGWYSRMTGETWRLPTDEEWAFAAGERFRSDIEGGEDDPQNPARRWLSSYQREVDLARKPDPQPRESGSFGMNEKGVADMAGNVWEWTSTCYVRVTIAPDGKTVESAVDNCGVHVVEGFHRTYMSNFIRDGKSGGCAIGLPPDNLGFRLVRERPGLWQRVRAALI